MTDNVSRPSFVSISLEPTVDSAPRSSWWIGRCKDRIVSWLKTSADLSPASVCASVIFIALLNGGVGAVAIVTGIENKDWETAVIGVAALGLGGIQCITGIKFGAQNLPDQLTFADVAGLVFGSPLAGYLGTFQVALPIVKLIPDWPQGAQAAIGAVTQMLASLGIGGVISPLFARLFNGVARIMGISQQVLVPRNNSELSEPLLNRPS